ncbi:hypothetical protein [Erythrobacter sp.]|jgi:hypothetical protein|uniref:hypothetical protein n=1 Tax=Erythrobacter sp. TaxID=1042 RepID=UPI002ECCC624|nr:hypothetical protein [Erythrobacter sp.]
MKTASSIPEHTLQYIAAGGTAGGFVLLVIANLAGSDADFWPFVIGALGGAVLTVYAILQED